MTEPPMHLVVRPALIADVDLVSPLFDAYRQFYHAEPDLGAARAFLADRLASGESVILLACVEPSPRGDHEGVIGFAQLYPSFSSLALGPTVVLNDLFVTPAWRGFGVARRLLAAVEAHARRMGAGRIELATELTNHRALRLYRAYGFVTDSAFTHLSLAVRPSAD